ncbi:MAG: FliM/FliN family flagellar motor switch protein [Armatimonadetes bacterium]|nr:FliM/FliN family flagellar motor switch protein [Armatimonadota bacterium]
MTAPAEEQPAPVAEPELTALADVPLQVTVRLGSTRLALRELLALEAGSVLQLDRQIGDPAEIMVGDRVVALGELVRVDSDLGVRITHVSGSGL